ncbi:MAG: c-type cytochrome [Planctomycetota bacterium]|jgi:mono/diheme cytochrome c family protein
MPIPEERVYVPNRLNRWFAVSSILMTGSIIWMIMSDYQRPWREFQKDYFVVKAAIAHLDYLDATRSEREADLEKAKRSLANARELLKVDAGGEIKQLETDLADAKLEFKKINGDFGQQAQVLEVTKDSYEKALAAHGDDHEDTIAAKKKLDAGKDRVANLQVEKEKWEDTAADIERALRELHAPVRDAEKAIDEIEKVRTAALKKDMQYRGVLFDEGPLADIPIVSAVIHFPLLDFVAPKTTPGRQQVKQLVLPDIRQRLNYLETYTTDRCVTCHVAIDDPDFSMQNLAVKLEKSLPGIDDALSRMGKDILGPPDPPKHPQTGKPLPAGRVTDHWDVLSDEEQKAYFEALVARTNEYLAMTDRKPIELGQPLLAHPDLELFVTVDSPHPMAQMGCTVCHEGNPQETDFVQAAHTPPTHEIEEKWADKYYVTEMGVPNITFDTVAHYWDRPMRLPKYSESGCSKCHSQVADIANYDGKRHGSQLNLGQQLFVQTGCINCHLVEDLKDSRRVGPDLSYMASKLSPEFTQQWINFPQKFRPSTRMPHFFQQENNDASSYNEYDPHPEFRTETEVAAVTHYLYALSQPWEPIAKPADVQGDPERGAALFASVGCQGCHSNLALNGEDWIVTDLVEREGIDEERARYRFKGMTYEQRVHYAMEHFPSQTDSVLNPDKVRWEEDGGYTPPVFSRFAPELSGIGSKVTFDWLYSWLIEPKHYSSETLMPSMRLAPNEAADIASYLLTLKNDDFKQSTFVMNDERRAEVRGLMKTLLSAQRSEARSEAIIRNQGNELTKMLTALLVSDTMDEQSAYDLVSGMPLEDQQMLYLGNKMIAHYGCYTCHTIRGFESTSPVGTELTYWAERPVSQLDFAFYDHAFHDMRHDKEEIYGYLYRDHYDALKHYSPVDDDAREEITHTHAAFARHKFLNPRIWDREKIKKPYDKLKMPNFYFTEEEADALVTYIMSRVPPRVNENLQVSYDLTTAGPIARGRDLTRELNCVGCHQFEDNVPMIQQYFRRVVGNTEFFDETNAPPRLWGQGAKVQSDWMHGFFANVETLRPWLQVRMPSFNLTSQQATDLVAYFASLSQYESAELAEAHKPVQEYQADARKKAEGQALEEGAPPPGSDWYQDDLLQKWAARLRGFGIDRKLIRAAEFDTLSRSDERVRAAHAKLLDRTDFLKSLYDIEYPFGEPPITLSSEDRFEMGSRFFTDMGCLKCHVMGPMEPGPAENTDRFVQVYRLDAVRGEGEDAVAILNGEAHRVGDKIDGHTLISAQNVYYDTGDVETSAIFEGPGPDGEMERIQLLAASAPNLGLTFKRLRRDWFEGWMLQPGLIQPGTKMPQNFADGKSPFEGDPDYPGTGMDHIDLLTDYVYEAGMKGARAPLPKIVVSAEEEEFDEDGEEFDEDEFDD